MLHFLSTSKNLLRLQNLNSHLYFLISSFNNSCLKDMVRYCLLHMVGLSRVCATSLIKEYVEHAPSKLCFRIRLESLNRDNFVK